MAVYNLGPNAYITGINFNDAGGGTEGPESDGYFYRIAINEYRSDLDTNFVGEGDGVTATSSASKAHQNFEPGGVEVVYYNSTDANAALSAHLGADEFGRAIFRIEMNSEIATAEDAYLVPLSDSAWVYYTGQNGWLPYNIGAGRVMAGVPDPNCPPVEVVYIFNGASEAHVLNYRAYADNGTSSWTVAVQSFGGPLITSYCIIAGGDPP